MDVKTEDGVSRRARVIALAKSWAGPAPQAKPKQKRLIDIEALLRWTYAQELPKARIEPQGPGTMAGAWDIVSRAMEELSLAGLEPNRYDVIPDPFAQDGPHPDALAVHDAVMRLDALELGLPEDWNPIADLGEIGGMGPQTIASAIERLTHIDAQGIRRLRETPRRLIVKHALLGGAPDWEMDKPEVKTITEHGMPKWFLRTTVPMDTANGETIEHEIEIDGFNRRRRIPKPGAYNKYFLDPDPFLGILARAEYEIWCAAMALIAEDLDGCLQDHDPQASKRALRPWECGGISVKPRIIHADLSSLRDEHVRKPRTKRCNKVQKAE